MADYSVTGGYKTVKVLSQTDALDVQHVMFVTGPSGFQGEYDIPYASFLDKPAAHDLLQTLADAFEDLAAHHHVIAMLYTQDPEPNGLLKDYEDTTVGYTGPFSTLTTTIRIPLQDFFSESPGIGGQSFPPTKGGQTPAEQCDQAYANLQALSGSGG